MNITRDTVKYVAELARMELSEPEISGLTRDLDGILGYIDKLNKLDTKDIPPSSHVLYLKNVFRRDEARPSLKPDEALANAPRRQDSFFKVPKIIN